MESFGQYPATCVITVTDVMTKSFKTAKQRATVNIRALSTFRCTLTTFVSGQLVLRACEVRPGAQLRRLATNSTSTPAELVARPPLFHHNSHAFIPVLQGTVILSSNHKAKDKKKKGKIEIEKKL